VIFAFQFFRVSRRFTGEVNVKKRVRERRFTGDAVVGGVSVVHDMSKPPFPALLKKW